MFSNIFFYYYYNYFFYRESLTMSYVLLPYIRGRFFAVQSVGGGGSTLHYKLTSCLYFIHILPYNFPGTFHALRSQGHF